MPLLVGQLIYTNLPKTGFQLMASQHIPLDLQDRFVQEVVYKLWDAYNPPSFDYQAIFLRQFSAQRTLFGWLYNDGHDELGRAHIPYFLAYYLSGKLDRDRLDHICDCLASGPVYFLERERLTQELAAVILPEADQYHSPRPGIFFLPDQKSQLHRDLQKRKLLSLDFSATSPPSTAELIPTVDYAEFSATEVTPPLFAETNHSEEINQQESFFSSEFSSLVLTNEDEFDNFKEDFKEKNITDLTDIEQIFQAAIDDLIGIRGAILLSQEGSPLTRAIGLEEERSLSLAGRLLKVAKETDKQFGWTDFDRISVHSGMGHLVLSLCLEETFLLVQTENMLTGLLEVEIKRMIKKIQGIYRDQKTSFVTDSLVLWKEDNEEEEDFNEMMMMPEEEVLYRGRRLSL